MAKSLGIEVTEGLSPLWVSIYGIEVHGQVVVCPENNDGAILDDTPAGYPELKSVACVHRRVEAVATLNLITGWQATFLSALGQRMVFASDEPYLLTGAFFPRIFEDEDLERVENGDGIAAAFSSAFHGHVAGRQEPQAT